MSASWSPTAERYLDGVTKAHVLAAVAEGVSPDVAERLSGLRKPEMVEAAQPHLVAARWLRLCCGRRAGRRSSPWRRRPATRRRPSRGTPADPVEAPRPSWWRPSRRRRGGLAAPPSFQPRLARRPILRDRPFRVGIAHRISTRRKSDLVFAAGQSRPDQDVLAVEDHQGGADRFRRRPGVHVDRQGAVLSSRVFLQAAPSFVSWRKLGSRGGARGLGDDGTDRIALEADGQDAATPDTAPPARTPNPPMAAKAISPQDRHRAVPTASSPGLI